MLSCLTENSPRIIGNLKWHKQCFMCGKYLFWIASAIEQEDSTTNDRIFVPAQCNSRLSHSTACRDSKNVLYCKRCYNEAVSFQFGSLKSGILLAENLKFCFSHLKVHSTKAIEIGNQWVRGWLAACEWLTVICLLPEMQRTPRNHWLAKRTQVKLKSSEWKPTCLLENTSPFLFYQQGYQ